jgi:hypothetical protein
MEVVSQRIIFGLVLSRLGLSLLVVREAPLAATTGFYRNPKPALQEGFRLALQRVPVIQRGPAARGATEPRHRKGRSPMAKSILNRSTVKPGDEVVCAATKDLERQAWLAFSAAQAVMERVGDFCGVAEAMGHDMGAMSRIVLLERIARVSTQIVEGDQLHDVLSDLAEIATELADELRTTPTKRDAA